MVICKGRNPVEFRQTQAPTSNGYVKWWVVDTQTWSYPAVVLYHKLGFYLCKNEGLRLDNDYHHGLLEVLATVIKEPMLTEIKQAAK